MIIVIDVQDCFRTALLRDLAAQGESDRSRQKAFVLPLMTRVWQVAIFVCAAYAGALPGKVLHIVRVRRLLRSLVLY